MATKERLEQALRNADAAGDVEAAKAFANAIRNGQYDAEKMPDEGSGILDSINSAITNNPVGATIAEGAAAVNRGATQLADMVTTEPANAVLELAGSDMRIPSITKSLSSATGGGFMEVGMPRDIVRAAGEVVPGAVVAGGLVRGAAEQLPAVAGAAEKIGTSLLRAAGSGTVAADAGYGAVSGAGGAIGREVGGDAGAMIGSIAAPLTVAGGGIALKSALGAGKRGIDAVIGSTKGVSEDGAATMLAEAMVREGLSPDDVAKQMAQMGDEGMLADAGNNFARLLRVASNKIPRIEGVAAQKFKGRHAGQGARLSGALDDGTGTPLLTVDDEIARLENTMGPKISELYKDAKSKPFAPSLRLRGLLEGDNSVGRAATEAQKNLSDYRAIGEQVGNMALIDETKKVLGAQISKAIREGDKGTSSRLLQLKKVMVDEADAAAPEYAKARSMFAGKEQLKDAAELGGYFFKTNPRELKQITETFGESEKRMYKLGAKQAIMDRFDNINANADLVGRTFGKNGDADKLRTLFDTQDQFNQFRGTLEREANWVLTRRAAQANSTTVKQLSDEDTAQQAFVMAREAISSPMGAANAIGRIMGGLSKKKGDADFVKSLEEAGDILLETGMNPEAVRSLLKKGSASMIEKALNNQIQRKSSKLPAIGAGLLNIQQENTQQAK